MSLLLCPVCGAPLEEKQRQYLCPNGHNYDRAREGYVHLLPANRMHSKNPGDDKQMAAARNRFLSEGFYAPLRAALTMLAMWHVPEGGAVLDAGCGEGYYTQGVYEALKQVGKAPSLVGVDLSKPSLKMAARRCPEGEFAVASVYHLPVASESVDFLLDCFAPLALEEFRRVLKKGGVFCYVVPAPDHLWELKQVLYDKPYRNPEEAVPYEGFTYLDIVPAESEMEVPGERLMDLFTMTPYYWKTPREGVERLEALESLAVKASFRIHLFRKD